MNLERVTVPIEPRTVGQNVDLALRFYRLHLAQIATLTLIFAIPIVALTFYLSVVTDSGFWLGLLLFVVFTPYLGAILVAGVGHQVFGDPFTVTEALRRFRHHAGVLVPEILFHRVLVLLGWLVVVAPGLMASVRYGYIAEMRILEELEGPRLRRRIMELTQSATSSPTLNHVATWMVLILTSVSLFLLLDLAAGQLLGWPILIGRDPGELTAADQVGAALDRLAYDPWANSVLGLVLWFVYPVARVAWFFCYLDQRIRNECWDVELDFRVEARRLS